MPDIGHFDHIAEYYLRKWKCEDDLGAKLKWRKYIFLSTWGH